MTVLRPHETQQFVSPLVMTFGPSNSPYLRKQNVTNGPAGRFVRVGGGVHIDVSRGGKSKDTHDGVASVSPDLSAMSPAARKAAMGVINSVPGMRNLETPEQAVEAMKGRLRATLEVASETGFTADRATASAHWYGVANDYAKSLAGEFGYKHHETAAAVLATLSPSAAWESNVRNAREVLQRVSENKVSGDTEVGYAVERARRALESKISVTEQSIKSGKSKSGAASNATQATVDGLRDELEQVNSPEFRASVAARMAGKRFNDLDEDDQVMVINGGIQSERKRGIQLVPASDGSYQVRDHSGAAIVQSADNVSKAIKIARADKDGADGEAIGQVISDNVSKQSKVRAFFQNIAHPNDLEQDAITADTHFWTAAYGTPYNAISAKPFFDASSSVGFAKTYPIARKALQDMMPELSKRFNLPAGTPARAAQSILWEMERHIASVKSKGDFVKRKAAMQELADRYDAGEDPLTVKRWYATETTRAKGGE